MCSRFENKTRPDTLKRRFRLKALPEAADDILSQPDRRPTDPILAILPGPEAAILRFGLAVSWDTAPLINARTETVGDKPTFRPLLDHRCLIPATAYFEWRRDGKARLKNRIKKEDDGLFAFAGLFNAADETALILTRAPLPAVAHIHGRMPVIMNQDEEEAWLDPDAPFAEAITHLHPFGALSAAEDTPPPPPQADLFG